MRNKFLSVNWKVIDGAARSKKILRLRQNDDGVYMCPIENCMHVGFKSSRGLRKHIDSQHEWYYYFDSQPALKRDNVFEDPEKVRRKQPTNRVPSFSITEGVGLEFIEWLQQPLGGGKNNKEAIQIATRGMKFLLSVMGGDSGNGSTATEEYIDCCLGSPSCVIQFIKLITTVWGLSSSAALNYVKSMSDLVDFRKSKGISDMVLRSFTVTEVYLRRGRDNLGKKKALEYSRNLDLESLIARDSWSDLEEMERVIPYHLPRFKQVVEKCSSEEPTATINDFAFASRFIVTYLFLRVKCTRPMTFQFMTLDMVKKAKISGYIDQTEFKTSSKYIFDTLVITDEVMSVLDMYIEKIRPQMQPKCDYVVVSNSGRQYNNFTTAMTLLVKEAVGKFINPTRYRQIIETESMSRLSIEEQQIVTKDQRHSSKVAERSYRKQCSRDVATKSKQCIEKLIGDSRDSSATELAGIVDTLTVEDKEIEETNNVINSTSATGVCIEKPCSSTSIEDDSINDIAITKSIAGVTDVDAIKSDETEQLDVSWPAMSEPIITVKKEVDPINGHKGKHAKFTHEEDLELVKGIKKHGKGNWSKMINDPALKYHQRRSRDSLRIRADSSRLKALCEAASKKNATRSREKTIVNKV